eukprot:TRINITY_DN1735_c0_g1_i1.p1 TRINITY_DN1735_c0_g1~~TRINITY_DN1735_c0_g1_i1.p1  ORF type:complete len:153 (-),score=26.31 TRINITY_DN1735_c0_g1_i1:37-471(-)
MSFLRAALSRRSVAPLFTRTITTSSTLRAAHGPKIVLPEDGVYRGPLPEDIELNHEEMYVDKDPLIQEGKFVSEKEAVGHLFTVLAGLGLFAGFIYITHPHWKSDIGPRQLPYNNLWEEFGKDPKAAPKNMDSWRDYLGEIHKK